MALQVFDRQHQKLVEEKVFGGSFIDWAYGSPLGRATVGSKGVQRLVSQLVGRYHFHPVSKSKIEGFVRDYHIEMGDFVEPADGFESFNDFFIRALQPGARKFPADKKRLGAPAEGRLTVFPISKGQLSLVVKGQRFSLEELLRGLAADSIAEFHEGHAWVFRLCPIDYHRYHFADAGVPSIPRHVSGALHSVNPQALRAIPRVFLENERIVTRFASENFGPLMYVEVGAMCVGLIRQNFEPGQRVERGCEKGYFEFGGSTVILLSQASRVIPDADLLERTQDGVESLVRLGEGIGQRS